MFDFLSEYPVASIASHWPRIFVVFSAGINLKELSIEKHVLKQNVAPQLSGLLVVVFLRIRDGGPSLVAPKMMC